MNVSSPFHQPITPNEVLAEQQSPFFKDMNSEWDICWINITKVVNIKSHKSSNIRKTILANSCGHCKSGEILALGKVIAVNIILIKK
jgi:hypothetical protein